jgi:hypothetical protein
MVKQNKGLTRIVIEITYHSPQDTYTFKGIYPKNFTQSGFLDKQQIYSTLRNIFIDGAKRRNITISLVANEETRNKLGSTYDSLSKLAMED